MARVFYPRALTHGNIVANSIKISKHSQCLLVLFIGPVCYPIIKNPAVRAG